MFYFIMSFAFVNIFLFRIRWRLHVSNRFEQEQQQTVNVADDCLDRSTGKQVHR